MKLLIVCDPEEGTATELCLFLKAEAEKMNRRVVLLNAESHMRSPIAFDAAIVAATTHGKGYGPVVTNYLSLFKDELTGMPTLFLSVYNCLDENNLIVPKEKQSIPSNYLLKIGLVPQYIFQTAVGSKLQENKYVALADWPKIKIVLQQFLIRNDVMMAG